MVQPVFISHSSLDKATADTVCSFLEAQGIACWIAPRNIPPGAKYGESIIHALEDALAVVFIFSEHSNVSEQVMNEIERAVNKRRPIFPLKISAITPSSELEYFISRRHWLDTTLAPLSTLLPQLAAGLEELAVRQAPVVLRGSGTAQKPTRVCVLAAAREGERLKLSMHEHALDEAPPVQHYAYLDVDFAVVHTHAESLLQLFERAVQQHEALDDAGWEAIQTHGAALYQQLLTPELQTQLAASSVTDLLLHLDEALVQIPWELLYDGTAFLGHRLNIGRFVSTYQHLVERKRQPQTHALKIGIIANPQGDLEVAAREGRTLQSELAFEGPRFAVALHQGPVGIETMRGALAQCDVLHYAGHTSYDPQKPAQSGFVLSDGTLTAADILRQGEEAPLPALVFCNACQSGQTTAWQEQQDMEQDLYGLANAFLLAGAQHYIGSFWDIPDEPGSLFAIEFYRALAHGTTIGMALRSARQLLTERYGATSVVPLSYMLYGNPTFQYLDTAQAQPRTAAPVTPGVVTPQVPSPRPQRSMPLLVGAGAAGVLVLLLAIWAGSRFWPAAPSGESPQLASRPGPSVRTPQPPAPVAGEDAYRLLEQGEVDKATALFQALVEKADPPLQGQGYTGLAAVAWARGDATQTLTYVAQAEALDPEGVYVHVLRGHVLWQQGKTDEAALAYQAATTKTRGLPWQQAVAHNRLGRLHAARGETQQALQAYDQALQHPAAGSPDQAIAYTNKGHLLASMGQFQEAIVQYRQAQQLHPADRLSAALLREAEQRARLTQDRDKQERIDQLVGALLQAQKEGTPAVEAGDGWTSAPLTLALMQLQTQGTPALRAGAEEAFLIKLVEALQATGRLVVLERDILDKLLAELKLGSSALADQQTALRVGRILASRLLATGTLTRRGTEAQLSLRVVETETTRLRVALTETLDAALEGEGVAERLAATLLQKLRSTYPLQGRLLQTAAQDFMVNIGAEHGVTPGMTLHVLHEEPLRVDGKVVSVHQQPVGLIEVTNVEARQAQVRVLEHSATFESGSKVKER